MLSIRPAIKTDTALIKDFIVQLAIYEKAEQEARATEADLRNTLFCDNPKVFALICEFENKPIGFAVYFFNYSTWLGKHGIYLEDLFVLPEHRGLGAGKALLARLAQIAIRNDCGRVEWSVLDWNTPAIDFYRALGATAQDEWTVYRLGGEALASLAKV